MDAAASTAHHVAGSPQLPAEARSLIRLALLFQLLAFLLVDALLVVGLVIHAGAIARIPVGGIAVVASAPIPLLYAGYEFSYRPAKRGALREARFPTLLLGILGIFFGAVVTGVFYLLAYVRLGDVLHRRRTR